MRVQVTEQHIKYGIRGSNSWCPVARLAAPRGSMVLMSATMSLTSWWKLSRGGFELHSRPKQSSS